MTMLRRILLIASLAAGCGGGTSDDTAVGDIDAAPDAPQGVCANCAPGTTCTQLFDGTCQVLNVCVETDLDCSDHVCTPECQTALCGASGTYQCETRPGCGTEDPDAFTCYGP